MNKKNDSTISRRNFFKKVIGSIVLLCSGIFLVKSRNNYQTVWQIDPNKCQNCGECATNCVMTPSAVKCFHLYATCGYCDFCSGYYQNNYIARNSAAENLRCPTNAIKRQFIDDPYFEYKIDLRLCIGCGRCAEACQAFGNGSLILQINQDLCKQCNVCNIASLCKYDAIRKIDAKSPYLLPEKHL
jgi:electron transport complex protein RnfB